MDRTIGEGIMNSSNESELNFQVEVNKDTLILTFLWITLQPPEEWKGGVGFVSKEMIKENCPSPAADIQILRCGPPPMNKAMAAHLEELGYSPEMQFQF
ncbi:hypothetical protein KSS87_006372 [Heliosperma pusillum]|nr:hypothetical protein KSS87_006372 [Heliosperma pusillum]